MRIWQRIRKALVLDWRGQRWWIGLAAIAYLAGVAVLWFYLPPVPRLRWRAPDNVQLLAFMPDGHRFFSFSVLNNRYFGPIRFWDARTGQQVATILSSDTQNLTLYPIGTAPDGHLLVWNNTWTNANCFGSSLHLVDLLTQEEIAELDAAPNAALAFSPDGSAMTYTVGNGQRNEPTAVVMWDVATREERFRLEGEDSQAVWSPDGKVLATGTPFYPAAAKNFQVIGEVKLWDALTGGHLATLSGHDGAARYLRFSPDGQVLAVGSETGALSSLKLWNTSSRRTIATIAGILGYAFLPDGHRLVTRHWDRQKKAGEVRVWDAATGELLQTIGRNDDTDCNGWGLPEPTADGKWLLVRSHWSSDPHFLRTWLAKLTGDRIAATYTNWSEITVYDAQSGQKMATIPAGDWTPSLILAPDGQSLATTEGNEIIIWDLPPARPWARILGWPLALGVLGVVIGRLLRHYRTRKSATAAIGGTISPPP